MQIATVQFEPHNSVEKNRELAAAYVRDATKKGADVIVLPEVWNVGYFNFDQYEVDAEPLDGESVQKMCDLAIDLGVAIHAGSIVEQDGNNLYNTSIFIGRDGKVKATYRKMHLFGYESDENELLTPGDEVVTFDSEHGRIGLATCYDLRFPALFRAMSDRDIDLLLVASAWPLERLQHWTLLTRVRAMEHQIFLAAANLVGENCGTRVGGNSCIIDPWGSQLANAGETERTVHADVNLDELEHARNSFTCAC